MIIHYYYSRERKRAERKTMADYSPSALCGHGQPISRIRSTSDTKQVTCQPCLDIIQQYPMYYQQPVKGEIR